jgi:hypothetical protein
MMGHIYGVLDLKWCLKVWKDSRVAGHLWLKRLDYRIVILCFSSKLQDSIRKW